MSDTYDVVVVGAGPGGITAAIYAVRAGLSTVIVEKLGVGGQIALSDIIENYPGFPSLSGGELMAKFEEHATGLGVQIRYGQVSGIDREDDSWLLRLSDGTTLRAKGVIISSGASPRPLGFAGEREFTGRGISTCGTCDGPFYRNKAIAVVGGGDTAVKESIYLSKIAAKVYHIHRRDRLRAEQILQDRIAARDNIEFCWNHEVEAALGDQSGVTGIRIKHKQTGQVRELAVDGIFVFVGTIPNTEFVDCDKDGAGFIKTDDHMATSLPGVYAVGDCRTTPLRQVATAVGDGAIAAYAAGEYLAELEGRAYQKQPGA